jgi:hypothetical protein
LSARGNKLGMCCLIFDDAKFKCLNLLFLL